MIERGGAAHAALVSFLVGSITAGVLAFPRDAAAYDALVNWQAVSSATSYRLYVRHGDGAFELAKERTAVAGTTVSDVIPNLPLELVTRFAVTAVNSGGESARSNERSIDYATAARVADSDGDSLTDAEEDIDLDGVVDPGETSALDDDSDNDGLSDFDERFVYETNPLRADTDGDGVSDGAEVDAGTDPLGAGQAPQVWLLAAGPSAAFRGNMTSGIAYANGADVDAAADSLGSRLAFANSTTNASGTAHTDDVSYTVTLPSSGNWYAWGRFYYPGTVESNDANSFFISVDGAAAMRFGNNKSLFRRWHWGGDGRYETGTPVAVPLGFLAAGTHVVTVDKREVSPIPPRLDVLMLTRDPAGVPTDAAARDALGIEEPAPPVTTTTLPACASDAACDDGNPCNGVETCDPTLGCQIGTPLACNDGNACNGVETCDPTSGCKAGTALVCNDGNVCNGVETCAPATGCKAGAALACNDGNACNGVETCNATSGCKAGTAPTCSDGNVCNGLETCDPASGCKAGTALSCSDGNACNGVETCDASTGCKSGAAPSCDDNNICNGLETCDPAVGCKAGSSLTCDDGRFCNGSETCNPAYGCAPGTAVNCNVLAGQCETGSCNEDRDSCEIKAAVDGTRCNDGLACTAADECVAGACGGIDTCAAGESCDANTNACELSGDVDNDGIVDAEDPCPDEARNLCAGDIATDRSKNLPIRINSGSSRATCAGDKTDCNGDRWYADFGYAKRLGTSSCTLAGACTLDGIEEIMGCVDTSTEDVFQCDHVGSRATGRVAYGFDVPDGKYIVNAYFAATQIGDDVGKRVFDITVEGETVYPRFDPVVAAGGIGVVVVRSVVVDVVDGNGLKITFQPRVGEVAVKAIEVLDAR